MNKKNLICEYCGTLITENDIKCPNCGANCSHIISQYQEERRKKTEKEMAEAKAFVNGTFKMVNRAQVFPIIFFGAFILIIAMIIIFSTQTSMNEHERFNGNDNPNPFDILNGGSSTKEEKKASVGFNEKAELNDYTVILDSYEEYDHNSENFPDVYNTKNGYQKIAFHFVIENISEKSIRTGFTGITISLKADNYAVDSADLTMCTFCHAAKGRETYPSILGQEIDAYDTLQGYVGFVVPKNNKTLEFKVGPNATITMDNPIYSE